jgi:ketosteroid isomerase-like protein
VILEVAMNAQENKAIARQTYDLFIAGNIPAMMDAYADDIVWIFPEVKGIPFGGTYQGKDGVQEFFTKLRDAVETLSMSPQRFVAEDDHVVAAGTTTRKGRATGITYTTTWMHMLTFKDGKLTRFEVYDNTAAIAEALMFSPPRA